MERLLFMPDGADELVRAEDEKGKPDKEKAPLLRYRKVFFIHENAKQEIQSGRKVLEKTGSGQIDLACAADKEQKRGQGDQTRADQQKRCRA